MHLRLMMLATVVLYAALWCIASPLDASADVKQALSLNKQGEKLLNQGDYAGAIKVFERMLNECGSHQYCVGVASFYLGRSNLELSRYDTALKFFEQAEQVFDKLNKKNEIAMVRAGKAKVLASRGDYQRALELLRTAEKTFEEVKNTKELYRLHNSMAVVLAYMCDFDRALDHLKRAAKLTGDSTDPNVVGPLNVNLGLVYSKRQDYEKAIAHYNLAMKSYESSGNRKGISILLNNIGHIHEAKSEYDKALAKHMESVKLAREIRDPWCESLALNNIGCVQLKRGDYEAAREAFDKALKIREALGIQHFAAETRNNMGLVWLAYADYPRAFQCFDKARRACEAAGAPSGKAWALHNMAFLFKDQGKFRESLGASNESVQIARQIGDRRLEATAILRLGNLYEYQGWFDKALENFRKAAAIQQEISDWDFCANTIAGAANILTRAGSLPEAEQHFVEAIGIKQKIGAPAAGLQLRFALFYLEKDRYASPDETTSDESEQQRKKDREKALELISAAEKELGPNQKNDLMLLTYVKGRYSLEEDPAQAIKDFSRLKALAQEAAVRKFAFLASVGLGLANERMERWEPAKQAYKVAVDYAETIRKTLDQESRLAFMEGEEILGVKHVLPYEGLARVLMRKGEQQASLTAAEHTKSRSFAESLARRWKNPSFDVPFEVYERDRALNDRLAALMKGLDKAFQEGAQEAVLVFKERIRTLEAELEQHIGELRQRYPMFAGSKYPGPLNLSQSAAKDTEWVLAFDVTENGLLIYLSHGKNLLRGLFKPVSRKELTELVRRFRQPLEIVPGEDDPIEKLNSFDLAAGKKLADLLLGDVLPDIPEGAHVVIVPDDALGILPFEMLVLNDSGRVVDDGDIPHVAGARFLGDRNPLSYYQSITALTLTRTLGKKTKPSDTLLIVADPVFNRLDARAISVNKQTRLAKADAQFSVALMNALKESGEGSFGFSRLPLTGDLAYGLGEMFEGKSEKYTGLDASKKMFIEKLAPELERYGRLVFATHGFFSKHSPYFREPILVLTLVPVGTDGFLRMSEVMGLKMNADIVALTACQTGLGRYVSGEGTMGMGRAFQYAGSRAVLMTLWSVSEDSSIQLVETFFQYLKEGKDKLEAIKLARKQIRNDGYDHPFFWAPFIIVGEVN